MRSIVVGTHPLLKVSVRNVEKRFGQRPQWFTTLDNALMFVREQLAREGA